MKCRHLKLVALIAQRGLRTELATYGERGAEVRACAGEADMVGDSLESRAGRKRKRRR